MGQEEDQLAHSMVEMYGDEALTVCQQYTGKLRQSGATEDLKVWAIVAAKVRDALNAR